MKTRTIKKSELPHARIGDIVLFDGDQWRITGECGWIRRSYWTASALNEENNEGDRPSEDDRSSLVTSAAVGYATDNAFIGGMVGGDHLGGIVGAALADSSTPDPAPSYSATDPSPVLESPDPAPSFDPSPSFDSSPAPDPSSFDNSGLV